MNASGMTSHQRYMLDQTGFSHLPRCLQGAAALADVQARTIDGPSTMPKGQRTLASFFQVSKPAKRKGTDEPGDRTKRLALASAAAPTKKAKKTETESRRGHVRVPKRQRAVGRHTARHYRFECQVFPNVRGGNTTGRHEVDIAKYRGQRGQGFHAAVRLCREEFERVAAQVHRRLISHHKKGRAVSTRA